MSERMNMSVLASSAMTSPQGSSSNHPAQNYYHDDELAAQHSHSRQYEQEHQFQARLSAPSIVQAAESDADDAGGMFYPPSTFAPGRMAVQQYSAVPASATAYQPQSDYVEADLPQPPSTSTSAYYSNANDSETHSNYPPPMSSLQSAVSLHQSSIPESPSVAVHAATPARHAQATGPPSPTNFRARRHTTRDIGHWKQFAFGPFAGRTIRAEIVEVQKADLGRKCADPPLTSGREDGTSRRGKERDHRDKNQTGDDGDKEKEDRAVRKDRRPLDPPPVVSLQLLESVHHGTPLQYERAIPAEDVEIGGLICQVDLYRVTIPSSPTEVASLTLHAGGSGIGNGQAFQEGSQHGNYAHASQGPGRLPLHVHHNAQHNQSTQSPYEQTNFSYPSTQRTRRESLLTTDDENGSVASPLDGRWESASPVSPVSPFTYHARPVSHTLAPPLPHPSFSTHGHPLHALSSPTLSAPIDPDALPLPSESDKLTRVLFGESYAHACSILDLQGKPALYFVFADLSVKLEGLFRPRYRFFDLFSRTEESADVPILAQCFGGAFAVYSTKEFPGLKASTPLTKHLSRWGIRVNIRETERKRRAPEGGSSNGGGAASKDRMRGGNGKKTRGGSVSAGVSSGTSVRGEDEVDERQPSGETTTIPRGVDAPRRYLAGSVRGRGNGGRTRTSASSSNIGASGSAVGEEGQTSGRGRKRT